MKLISIHITLMLLLISLNSLADETQPGSDPSGNISSKYELATKDIRGAELYQDKFPNIKMNV